MAWLVKIKEVPWPGWLRSRRCRGQLVKIKEVPWPVG